MALTMQTDGNLVLYAPGHVAIWATGTSSAGNSTILAEPSDRNLVVIAPGNQPVWASGAGCHVGVGPLGRPVAQRGSRWRVRAGNRGQG